MLYISRTTIINFISLICLIKYEFEKSINLPAFHLFLTLCLFTSFTLQLASLQHGDA